MNLIAKNEIIEKINKEGVVMTEEEKQFLIQFAIKTGDAKRTEELLKELTSKEKNTDAIITKYSTMLEVKPQWVVRIENLLVALEMYRIEEEKAINRLSTILNSYGIDITVDEIRSKDTEEIKETVHKKVIL